MALTVSRSGSTVINNGMMFGTVLSASEKKTMLCHKQLGSDTKYISQQFQLNDITNTLQHKTVAAFNSEGQCSQQAW